MWIGLALVVTVSGNFVTAAQPFFTEAECRAQTAHTIGELAKSQQAVAYRFECMSDKALVRKKIQPAPTPKDAAPAKRSPKRRIES